VFWWFGESPFGGAYYDTQHIYNDLKGGMLAFEMNWRPLTLASLRRFVCAWKTSSDTISNGLSASNLSNLIN